MVIKDVSKTQYKVLEKMQDGYTLTTGLTSIWLSKETAHILVRYATREALLRKGFIRCITGQLKFDKCYEITPLGIEALERNKYGNQYTKR